MPSYHLRDIDSKLWKRVKVQAAQQGEPIRAVLIRALTAYAAGQSGRSLGKSASERRRKGAITS